MTQRKLPYLFLLILIIILIFVGGVKYGQKVEEANKVIKYVLSITPTKSPPKPTPTLSLEFKTVTYCDMSFIIPSYLKYEGGVNDSADRYIDKDDNSAIILVCYDPTIQPDSAKILGFPNKAKDFLVSVNSKDVTATVSGQFKNSAAENKVYSGKKGIRYIRLIHPKTGYFIYVDIDERLYPLFEKTLEFTTPIPMKPTQTTLPHNFCTKDGICN